MNVLANISKSRPFCLWAHVRIAIFFLAEKRWQGTGECWVEAFVQ